MDTDRSISFTTLRQVNDRLFNHSVHLSRRLEGHPPSMCGLRLCGTLAPELRRIPLLRGWVNREERRVFRGLKPHSAIPSTPRSLVFVAGAFFRSSCPAHGADRND